MVFFSGGIHIKYAITLEAENDRSDNSGSP